MERFRWAEARPQRPLPLRVREEIQEVLWAVMTLGHRMDAAQPKDMFRGKTPEGQYVEWMAAFCQRKYNSDFAREMTRSVGEYINEYES